VLIPFFGLFEQTKGLVSTFLLIAGVVGANLSSTDILLTALSGTIAGAISMAAGKAKFMPFAVCPYRLSYTPSLSLTLVLDLSNDLSLLYASAPLLNADMIHTKKRRGRSNQDATRSHGC
jgi:hypothetical protein